MSHSFELCNLFTAESKAQRCFLACWKAPAAASMCGWTVCLHRTRETGLESSSPFQLIGRGLALKFIGICVINCRHCILFLLCVAGNNSPPHQIWSLFWSKDVERQHGSWGDWPALWDGGILLGNIPLLEISRQQASLSAGVKRGPLTRDLLIW